MPDAKSIQSGFSKLSFAKRDKLARDVGHKTTCKGCKGNTELELLRRARTHVLDGKLVAPLPEQVALEAEPGPVVVASVPALLVLEAKELEDDAFGGNDDEQQAAKGKEQYDEEAEEEDEEAPSSKLLALQRCGEVKAHVATMAEAPCFQALAAPASGLTVATQLQLASVIDAGAAGAIAEPEGMDEKAKAIFDSYSLLFRKVGDVWPKGGVETFSAEAGEKFDPVRHVMVEEREASEDEKPGTVAEIVKSGWKCDGKVVLPSQVVVLSASVAEEEEAPAMAADMFGGGGDDDGDY